MSDLDLEPIKRRTEAATGGPWWAWDRGVGWEIAVGKPADDGYPAAGLPEGTCEGTLTEADAEFIAAARRDVPALVDEVEGLRACVEDEEEMVRGIRESLAWVEREYRQCIVAARVTHDSVHYATCNGRAEAYRQLADQVAAAAGLQAPDWDRIRREVPSDGIYRSEVINGGG